MKSRLAWLRWGGGTAHAFVVGQDGKMQKQALCRLRPGKDVEIVNFSSATVPKCGWCDLEMRKLRRLREGFRDPGPGTPEKRGEAPQLEVVRGLSPEAEKAILDEIAGWEWPEPKRHLRLVKGRE